MSETKTLDARGLSCPQPALETERLLKNLASGTAQVLVDSGTSRDNVARIAKNAGWAVEITSESGGAYRLILSK
jgi:tRNA 2-thiouridine synthesizing protein A